MKRRVWLFTMCFLAALAWSSNSRAQTAAPPADAQPGTQKDNFTPRKLLGVTATGSQRFKPQAIASASGLTLGMTAGEDEFRRAAERLGDSGVFSDVTYTYSYSDAGVKLTLQVKDAAEFVPARFEDFVGFSDDELLARIREREPLFDGTLPVSGKLTMRVSDILQGLLIEKHIPGRVEFDRMVREDGGPVQAILYSIEGVSILIRSARLTGAGPEERPRLETLIERLKGRDYKRSTLEYAIEKQILPVFHEQGYLKAEVTMPAPQLAPAPADSREDATQTTFVDIEFVAHPGSQYRLAGIEWSGNKAVPTSQMNSLLRGRSGELANTVQLAADLERARQLYASQGYIRAAIRADATFDDAARSVQFSLHVTEGEQYKMGELDLRGVDRTQEERLRSLWRIRAGEVYNGGYLQSFLADAVKSLPRNLDWVPTHHVTANVVTKTVDVEVTFTAQATK